MAGKIRHFIVFYRGTYGAGSESFGHHGFETENGHYLNCDAAIELIRKEHKLLAVGLTNVIELSKKDYDSWSYRSKGISDG